jgi:hypothetical protein
MYATDFDQGVGLGDVLQACLDGAHKGWHGEVQAFFDGQARFRLSFVDGRVTAESVGLAIGVVDRRLRLITAVVEDPTGAGVCGWNMHCHANDTLNDDPARPLTEAAAERAFRVVDGRFIDLRELLTSG